MLQRSATQMENYALALQVGVNFCFIALICRDSIDAPPFLRNGRKGGARRHFPFSRRRNILKNLPCGSETFIEQLKQLAGRVLRFRLKVAFSFNVLPFLFLSCLKKGSVPFLLSSFLLSSFCRFS